jgi:hypothetical protein
MDIDKIISIVRMLREDGGMMVTGSTAGAPGFSGAADPKGPTAGFDPLMDGRSKMMRRLPPQYSKALRKRDKKSKKKKR